MPIPKSLDDTDDIFLQDEPGLTMGQHALQCSEAFQTYMAASQNELHSSMVRNEMVRFTLWAFNMDVFEPPNVSLDYRLRYSPKLVDILHHLLNVILTTLKDSKSFLRP